MTTRASAPLSASNIVTFLQDIFERRGADSYLGEEVTMSQHMLQGALLAEEARAGDLLVAAALLHDIGHYTSEFPEEALAEGTNNYHDEAGATVLVPYFPALVTDCVRHHVAAKRYLCATDPGYFDRLTPASVHSLKLQGGPMTEAEAAAFRKTPHLDAILQVRFWDEAGKVAGKVTPPFSHYAPLLQRVVETHKDHA